MELVDVHAAADAALTAAVALEAKHGRHRGPSEAAINAGSVQAASEQSHGAALGASGGLGSDLGGLAPWLPPALRCALNFSSVRRSVGHGIMWADDGRGLGVLWIKVRMWGGATACLHVLWPAWYHRGMQAYRLCWECWARCLVLPLVTA
jgi:hypothetical protein